MTKNGGLTPKQEAFCLAYVETGNASEAYRRAYDTSRMKDGVIRVKACEVMAHEAVDARIAELRATMVKRHEVTVDRIVQELAKIAFVDAEKDENAVIQNKLSALDKLGKHFGMFVVKTEHTGKDGAPLVPELPENRDLARVILSILSQAQIAKEDTPR